MPHITTAMERSVRRGVSDIFFESLLGRRSITGDVNNVKNSFSSWSNCMAVTYCKWPVIAIIIIGGLILLSIVSCIIRCACCGMSCCCSCFSCLNCCCGGCCDGKKRNGGEKQLGESNPFGERDQGYQQQAPMMGGGLSTAGLPTSAQFEVGKNGLYVDPKPALSEDALPPMPSWDSAQKKHVIDEKDGVELGNLDHTTGQKVPLMAGAASPGLNTSSPVQTPLGGPSQGAGGNRYMGVGADTYSPQPQNSLYNGGYRGTPPPQGMGQRRPYGPGQDMNSPGRGFGPSSPEDQYGGNQYMGSGRPPPQGQFFNNQGQFPPQRQFSNERPPPQRQFSNDSSQPFNPGRQNIQRPEYSDRSYDDYEGNIPPSRGPSSANMRAPASPGPVNNSGFDFGSGDEQPYSRPTPPPQLMQYGQPDRRGTPQQGYRQPERREIPQQGPYGQPERRGTPQQGPYGQSERRGTPQQGYGQSERRGTPSRQNTGGYESSTAPPSYATRSPPQNPVYPGYKSYSPAPSQEASGSPPSVLTPGAGRREPQGWDPVRE